MCVYVCVDMPFILYARYRNLVVHTELTNSQAAQMAGYNVKLSGCRYKPCRLLWYSAYGAAGRPYAYRYCRR